MYPHAPIPICTMYRTAPCTQATRSPACSSYPHTGHVVTVHPATLTVFRGPLAELGMPEHKDMPNTVIGQTSPIPSQIQYIDWPELS